MNDESIVEGMDTRKMDQVKKEQNKLETVMERKYSTGVIIFTLIVTNKE